MDVDGPKIHEYVDVQIMTRNTSVAPSSVRRLATSSEFLCKLGTHIRSRMTITVA